MMISPAMREKSRLPVSFMLAGGLHFFAILGGHYGFIQAPEYGMQGSAASMEIHMVAALPEYSQSQVVKSGARESSPELLTAASEMEIAKQAEKKQEEGSEKDNPLKSSKAKESKKSEVKGDGSSPVPGQSVTTLFARGSSETDGKAGKYQNPPPQYPFAAERNGWEGVVVLRALIEKEGKPAQVLVDKSSGHRILDEAALDAVKEWKFTAGRMGGMEVSSWIKIPIRFELKKSRR